METWRERAEGQQIQAVKPSLSQAVTEKVAQQIFVPQDSREIHPKQLISQEIPVKSQKQLTKPKIEQKTSLSANEIVPYVLLAGFYLLLSATIYVATRLLIEWFTQGFFTSLNIFIYIYIMATLFVVSGYFVHRSLKKRSLPHI